MSLFKLRNTWPHYFPAVFLRKLDLAVMDLDPNWPVLEIPSSEGTIHLNPRFILKVCLTKYLVVIEVYFFFHALNTVFS